MKLDKKDYNKAVGCLKRYNYNCINIINTQRDILSLSVNPLSDAPRVPYSVGDTTLSKVIKLENSEELQISIKEYKAVVQALTLTDKITKEIFEMQYQKRRRKQMENDRQITHK